MPILRDKFDFEIGTLIKSPCKECEDRRLVFPGCTRECRLLDEIQTLLASGICCSRNHSPAEDFTICIEPQKSR